ncbi:MAG: hypothetical protein ACJ72O_17360 [Marmoricola sp.]
MSSKPFLAACALALLLGTGACGKDEPKAEPTSSVTGTPTEGASSSGTPSESPTATATESSPAVNLPQGFPAQKDVPLVAGVVTSQTGGTDPSGKIGWIIEMSAAGSKKDCFDRAAAALVSHGFTKQGEMDAKDTHQAQFTTKDWAVIISARADGENCQLGYEVGQLSK